MLEISFSNEYDSFQCVILSLTFLFVGGERAEDDIPLRTYSIVTAPRTEVSKVS